MAQTELRIVGLADALADLLPALEERLRAHGALCPEDEAVYGALRAVAIWAEEDAGVVTYALSLFRANPRSRRSTARREHLEETYGALPPAPWEPEAA